jgi:hypothetical protein
MFGTALGQGLQALAQMKLQQYQQAQQAKQQEAGLRALVPGLTEEQASSMSKLPPQILGPAIKSLIEQPYEQMLASRLTGEQQTIVPEGQMFSALSGLTPGQQAQIPITSAMQTPSEQISSEIPRQQQIQPTVSKPSKYAGLKAKDIAVLRKLEQGEEKQKSEAFKQTATFRKELLEKGRSAKTNLQDLERMEALEKEGKLDTPGYVEFLKNSGFDIPALMKPGSEEFQKIAANFMRDARQYFGARISNFELQSFLKTIPSLSQSPEGRKRVIANLKRIARAGVEYSKSMRDIVAKNKGVPPLDLMERVEDDIEKKMDKISAQFKSELEKPVPLASSKFHTALGAILGKTVGGITGLLGLPGKIGSALGNIGGGGIEGGE